MPVLIFKIESFKVDSINNCKKVDEGHIERLYQLFKLFYTVEIDFDKPKL